MRAKSQWGLTFYYRSFMTVTYFARSCSHLPTKDLRSPHIPYLTPLSSFPGVSRRYLTCAHLRRPVSYHPASTAFSSSPLWTPRAGQPWVSAGTTVSSAEFCCPSQADPINGTPPDSHKTVLFPWDPVSTSVTSPSPFNYSSVLKPWKCQVKGYGGTKHTVESYRSCNEEFFPLSHMVPTLWRLQHGELRTTPL